MTDAGQNRLLDRILTSIRFSHAESFKRRLRYICVRSAAGAIGQYDPAANALNMDSVEHVTHRVS